MKALLLCLLAQVAVEKPPDLAVMATTLKEARAKRPLDVKALLAIKQGPIDASLSADLVEFDWYRAGGWSYPEKKFDVWYEQEAVSQYDFFRYLPNGTELSFTLVTDQRGAIPSQVRHLNFTEPPPTSAAIKKVGKQTYLEITAYGEKELHRVVSYERGVLILDISYDGKPNSKTVKFRDTRVAFRRLFESTGK